MGRPRAGGVNPMHGSVKIGLLIVGHGSRDALANAESRHWSTEYREAPGVRGRPRLRRAGPAGAARGARRAGTALPGGGRAAALLFAAGHVKNDLPLALAEARRAFPATRFSAARALGVDPGLVDLAYARARPFFDEAAAKDGGGRGGTRIERSGRER